MKNKLKMKEKEMKITNRFLEGKSENFLSSAKEKRFIFEVVQIEEFFKINQLIIIRKKGLLN